MHDKCMIGILQNRYTSAALNKRCDQNDGPKRNYALHVRLGVGIGSRTRSGLRWLTDYVVAEAEG